MIFYFLYAASFTTCLLGLQLYAKLNNKDLVNKIVAAILVTLLIHVIHLAMFKDIIDGLDYVTMAAPNSLLYGPFLYLCYMVSEGKSVSRKKQWIHFVPFLLGFIFYVFFLVDATFRYQYGMAYYYLLYSSISGSFLFYSIYILFKSSNSQSINLNVQRLCFYSIILLLVMAVFILTLLFNSGDETAQISSPVSNSIIFGIMFLSSLVGYNFFLTQFQNSYNLIETNKVILGDLPNNREASELVLRPNNFSSSNSSIHKEKLIAYLNQKTFLESDFTIEMMATDLKIPKPVINQLIKSHFNNNFIKTINSLRIKEACKELQSESFDMNIDELALRCGFKSRASFYRYFSQELRCSPMEYREKFN